MILPRLRVYNFSLVMMLFFVLSHIPFYLVHGKLSIWVLFPIWCIVLVYFMLFAKIKKKNHFAIIILLLIFLLNNIIVNTNNILLYLMEMVIILISSLIYYDLQGNKMQFLRMINFWVKFLYFVCAIGIVAHLVYFGFSGVFPYVSDVGGYSRYELYGLGRFYRGFLMPDRFSSFTYEPLYLGLFAGLNALLILKLHVPVYRRKLLFVLLLGLGVSSFSMSFLLAFLLSFIAYLLLWVIPEKKKLLVLSIGSLMVSAIVILNITAITNGLNAYNEALLVSSDRTKSTSVGDRTGRLNRTLNIIPQSDPFEWVFGRGTGYISQTYSWGEPNTFLLILIEYGVLGLIVLLLFLFASFGRHVMLLIFILISLLGSSSVITPFFLVNASLLRLSFYHKMS